LKGKLFFFFAPMAAQPNAFLDAFYDPVAGLRCLTSGLKLVDLAGDSDVRLACADLECRLRVYRGTSLSSSSPLLGEPAGLAYFYPDTTTPRVPSLAIASGNSVYIYRHLRPYLKFTLPSVPISTEELAAWDAVKSGGSSDAALASAAARFAALRDGGGRLSSRAADLLALPGGGERRALLEAAAGKPLVQATVVTAVDSINRARLGAREPSSLVLATEAAQLLFLDPVGAAVAATVELPAVASQVLAWGVLEGEHRVYAAARDGAVYAVKSAALMPTRVEPPAPPVALARTGSALVVACMDGAVVGYPPAGAAPLWSVRMPAPVMTIARLLVVRDRTVDAVGVALEGGEVRVLAPREDGGGGGGGDAGARAPALVASFRAPDTVVGMAFGQYGREGNALALTLRSGGLLVKMLRRAASLEPPAAPGGAVGGAIAEQGVPLPIPKKTRLALEQAERERECGLEMHRVFQRGLVRVRLAAAKEYLRVLLAAGGAGAAAALEAANAAIGGGGGGGAHGGAAPLAPAGQLAPPKPPLLALSAEVLGLGPAFGLRVTVRCGGGGGPAVGVALAAAACASGTYALPAPLRPLPPLLPGGAAVVDLEVVSLQPEGVAGAVAVHAVQMGAAPQARPLVSAVVAMPVSAPGV
jgi:Bardet-Biedl syndrome 1 protein